jgi:uncharacterized protein
VKTILSKCKGFQWDDGNSNKNWYLHQVTDSECEEIFFNLPLIVLSDSKHSKQEKRFFALSRTEVNRWLFIVFTVRDDLIRVISTREMTKSEGKKYAEEIKRNSEL